MKKTIILICGLYMILGSSMVSAQQPAQYSMYMFNKFNWNPAYAGLDNSLSITGVYRKQWVDLEGSPEGQSVNMHMPLYIARGGIGLSVENDVLGAQRITSFSLAYNYQLYLGKNILSFGINSGIVQRSLDGSLLRTPEGNYLEPGVIQHEDNLLPISRVTGAAPHLGLGVYLQGERLELGVSVRNLMESEADLGLLPLTLKRNFFFNGFYQLDLTSNVTLQPSVMVQSDLTQTQVDFSAVARYNDNIFAGASFRGYNPDTIDAVAIIFGFRLSENMQLGYSYDVTLSDISAVSNGSHEIMVNYNLNKRIGAGIPPKIIYNPRSL